MQKCKCEHVSMLMFSTFVSRPSRTHTQREHHNRHGGLKPLQAAQCSLHHAGFQTGQTTCSGFTWSRPDDPVCPEGDARGEIIKGPSNELLWVPSSADSFNPRIKYLKYAGFTYCKFYTTIKQSCSYMEICKTAFNCLNRNIRYISIDDIVKSNHFEVQYISYH